MIHKIIEESSIWRCPRKVGCCEVVAPVFLLFALLSVTTAVGANVLIGQALGKSETEEANKLFHIQLTAGLVETVVCMVTGIFGGRKLLYAIGATDTIINLAESYIFIVFLLLIIHY